MNVRHALLRLWLCTPASSGGPNSFCCWTWLCVFPQEDAVIKGIERRISYVTHIPEVNGEGLQILHYEDGQKYEAHHDFFHDKFNSRPENGGQRIATVLMYL